VPAALEAARSEKFDLIISDIGMPGMNGYELAKELRSLPEYRTVPVGPARSHSCRGPMRSVPPCGSGWVLLALIHAAVP
jgi:hypothetical protein